VSLEEEDVAAGIRVVLDTNCLLRYLICPGAAIRELIEIWWLEDRICLVTSPELLEELTAVLARPRIQAVVRPHEGAALLDAMRYKAEILSPLGSIPRYSRDAKDDKFVACAVARHAAYLITEDLDLLDLKDVAGVRILQPHVFLAQNRKTTASDRG
jgi:putative PIN family toxin of toxin-antitoxin system